METWVWIVIAAAAAVVLLLLVYAMRRKRRHDHLQERFGPEYDAPSPAKGGVTANST